MTFPLGKWVSSPTIKKGRCDSGGIWLTISLGNARKLAKYMVEKYDVKCRIYKGSIGRVLYKNNYRLKTDRVKLIEEIIQKHIGSGKMKEFEKWWDKNKGKFTDIIDYKAFGKEKAARFLWKVALEWVLDRIDFHYGDELNNSDIVLDIKEELKEE